MLDFRSPVPVDGKDGDGDPAPLLVDKYFDHGQFGGGEVILRPGKEKGRQHVRSDTMVQKNCKIDLLSCLWKYSVPQVPE